MDALTTTRQMMSIIRRAPPPALTVLRHGIHAPSSSSSSRIQSLFPLNPSHESCSFSLFATSNKENESTTMMEDDDDDDDDEQSSLTLQIALELQATKVVGGLLLPLAQVLEDVTGGWALTYADLAPETHKTPVGVGFLATNMAYTICGLLLVQSGNVLLGVLTELASVASFAYHFTQLKLGKNQPIVRVALLVDYVVAAATLLAALVYILQVGVQNVPLDGIIASVLAVVFLFLSWVWEEGLPYVINHGMWHLLGAYGGFIIGQAQYSSNGGGGWWWQ